MHAYVHNMDLWNANLQLKFKLPRSNFVKGYPKQKEPAVHEYILLDMQMLIASWGKPEHNLQTF